MRSAKLLKPASSRALSMEESRSRGSRSRESEAAGSSDSLTLDPRLLTLHRGRLNRSGSGVATSSGASCSIGLPMLGRSSPSAFALGGHRGRTAGRLAAARRLRSGSRARRRALACCSAWTTSGYVPPSSTIARITSSTLVETIALLRLARRREAADRDLVAASCR